MGVTGQRLAISKDHSLRTIATGDRDDRAVTPLALRFLACIAPLQPAPSGPTTSAPNWQIDFFRSDTLSPHLKAPPVLPPGPGGYGQQYPV